MYVPSPQQKLTRRRSYYAKPNQTKPHVKVNMPKCTFKYEIEVPKSWKSIIRIDLVVSNILEGLCEERSGNIGFLPVL